MAGRKQGVIALQVGDIVESTDWREHGKTRTVTSIPQDGEHKGYVFLQSGSSFSTRVRLRKNGNPERYRLVEQNQDTLIEE